MSIPDRPGTTRPGPTAARKTRSRPTDGARGGPALAGPASRTDPVTAIDVWILVERHTLLLDLAGASEALRLANQALRRRGEPEAFRLRYCGAQAQALSSVGLTLGALEPLPALGATDWLILSGRRHPHPSDPAPTSAERAEDLSIERWLHREGGALLTGGAGRLLSICAGALLAARAGLLDGRRCTTHHESLDALRAAAPNAEVQANRVFVLDGPLASSAGITAGIDLVLALIAERCGEALAATVAQVMVVYLRRGAQDPELSPMLAHRHHLHPALHRVQDAICAQPGADWSLTRMAAVAHVTPRHLTRLFSQHGGTTPLDYLRAIRLELARRELARGARPAQAALAAGFSSDQQLRRTRRKLSEGLTQSA
ncbi:MAG: helix-turn-helix domain-containing protein [Mitsuaria chitosanitabida]|uniref:GlxA family transcriptional regulator n=1 Tax=Roseateles chitosanitabidus TaxID=65048 RepID=UPI001B193DD1|nr:helix-turn-helix domain-containing protein [Roseateles chitosanitabidus]MBO9686037.1 helix-turn-helix domain-containing protein [Roseateles chitosanitabidus]